MSKFSAKAHTRREHSYSPFHQSLLHEDNQQDYALRHIYSLENTKELLKQWGWDSEDIKDSMNFAVIDVYPNVVWLKIPKGEVVKGRGERKKTRGICRFISKADYLAVLVKRQWEKADPYKIHPSNEWYELVAKGMEDEFYELSLSQDAITCTCHAHRGLSKAFMQDSYILNLLVNHPTLQGQLPDKHCLGAWKYLGATTFEEYLLQWRIRKQTATVDEEAHDFWF